MVSRMEKKGAYYALVATQESAQKAEEDEASKLPHEHTSAMLTRQLSEQSAESQNARIAREKKEISRCSSCFFMCF